MRLNNLLAELELSVDKKKGLQSKNCILYGYNKHTTNKCKAMLQQAKKMKSSHDGDRKPAPKTYKNKTWVRKPSSGSKETTRDLASFLQNEIQKGSAKEMASLKHKATEKPEAEPVEEDNHTTANIKDLDYDDLDSVDLEGSQEAIKIDSDASEESS